MEQMNEILRKMIYSNPKLNARRMIVLTDHAVDRFNDNKRFSDKALQKEGYRTREDFIMTVYDKIKLAIEEILTKYNDQSSTYVVHSKSTGIGVVVEWRRDRFDKLDINNNAYIHSVLEIKKPAHYTTNPKDIYMVVEKQIVEWAKRYQLETMGRRVSNESCMYDRVQTGDSCNEEGFQYLKVHFFEGRVVNCDVDIIIVP